jgi:hypothetical protein
MNAGFEMIWCDFNSPSLRLVSRLNVTAPLLPPKDDGQALHRRSEYDPTSYFPLPPAPTRTDKSIDPTNAPTFPIDGKWDQEPFLSSKLWNWFLSGVAHYGSSGDGPGIGEVRVKPASCGFLSYYSPIFTNQAESRAKEERKTLNLTMDGYWTGPTKNDSRSHALDSLTRRRRLHALEGVTTDEATLMKKDSERVLRDLISRSPANCSGIDWSVMTNEIVRTYAGPLKVFLKTLEKHEQLPKRNDTALKNWIASIRDQTHDFLVAFLEYPDDGTGEAYWVRNSTRFNETYSRCQLQFTRLLDPQEGILLGQEEWTLKWAVEETLGGICSVLVDVGLSVEGLWQSKFNQASTTTTKAHFLESLREEFVRWTHGVEELMAWLGWAGEWTRCEQKCALDEKCFIPMWPLIKMERPPGRRYPPPYRYGPGYGPPPRYPYPYGGFPEFRPNRTRGRPGGRWGGKQDETLLWNPICVKADYIVRG